MANIIASNIDKNVAVIEKLPASAGGGDLDGKDLPELPAAVKNRSTSYTVNKLRILSRRFRRENRLPRQRLQGDHAAAPRQQLSARCQRCPPN